MISPIPLIDVAETFGGTRTKGAEATGFVVTVICVTRNAQAVLPALIESVARQKSRHFEFIVVDGRSTDHTINILRDNEDVVDYWISRPDEGIYDAMNKALHLALGQWVIFVGADDLLLDGFNAMLGELKDPHTIYYSNLLYYGEAFEKVYDDYYLTKLNFCQQAIFYPVLVFKKYQFDLRYRVYADYHLNLRCWNDPEFNFVHADHTVSYFSDGGFSSVEKDPEFDRDRDMLFKKYLKRSSYFRYLNRTIGFPRMLIRFIQNK